MSLLVKICGMRTAEDVAAAVDAGADAVGFVFAESPRRVSAAEARDALRDVRGRTLCVAVMKGPANDEWQEILEVLGPDVLQTDIEDYVSLDVPDSVRRWPVIREGAKMDAPPVEFLYEGRKSGSGQTVNWNKAAIFARHGGLILAGGLSPSNVGDAIAAVRPLGVDVSSSVESPPGVKDPELIRAFMRAARAAEQAI